MLNFDSQSPAPKFSAAPEAQVQAQVKALTKTQLKKISNSTLLDEVKSPTFKSHGPQELESKLGHDADAQSQLNRQHQAKHQTDTIRLARQSESNQMTSQTEDWHTIEQIELFCASKAPKPEKVQIITGNSAILKNKSRYIPLATRRLLWAKHEGKCTYQGKRILGIRSRSSSNPKSKVYRTSLNPMVQI